MHQTSEGVSGKGEGKNKRNPERCDCNSFVKNAILGKVIALSDGEKGLDLTSTPSTASLPRPSTALSQNSHFGLGTQQEDSEGWCLGIQHVCPG